MRKLALVSSVWVVSGVAVAGAMAASSPSVITRSANGIGQTQATLHGNVNPNGAATKYFFQWGPTTAYGFTGPQKSAGAGVKTVSVSGAATGLLPGTLYHYRLVAENAFGVTVGGDEAFTSHGHSLPGAVTGPATGISTSGATVTGTVVTNGVTTPYQFEYGTASGVYTAFTPTLVATASATPVGVSSPIAPLPAGTTIYYRLIAYRTGFPASYGPQAQFTTLPLSRPSPHVHASTLPHLTSSPFTFTTSGSIASSAFPAQAECSGNVGIRYFLGRRSVSYQQVAVQPNCTFANQKTFSHKFKINGHRPSSERLKVVVHFLGNGYLAPAKARPGHVTLA
jgi:hypothetical protein